MQRLRPVHVDLTLAAVITAWNQVELATLAEFTDGREVLNVCLFALMTGAVALRRVAPLAGACVASAALTAQTAWGGDVFGAAAQFVALLVVTHAVGAHVDPRRALVGLAVMIVGVESYPFLTSDEVVIADEVGNTAVFVAIWGLAYAIRSGHDRRRRLVTEHQARETAAVERERDRIARELHDVVAHGLSVMVLHAGAARDLATVDRGAVTDALDVIADAGRRAVLDLHSMLAALSGTSEGGGDTVVGLADLRGLCDTVSRSGVDVHLTEAGLELVDDLALELSAYRVVQEALTNTVRYAQGSRVDVRVEGVGGRLEVDVTDDGGKSPAIPGSSGTGLGLRGLRERVEMFGGSFSAGPTGRGFRVHATLPLRSAS